MATGFFCHADEDADIVDAVYRAVVKRFPEDEQWLDRYEIVAGDSLLEKIAEGIYAADRFFILLSAVTVEKEWAKRELRVAIMREINEVNPQFIVPVKVGDLDRLPAFLEDKYYIDLSTLTEPEWAAAFDAALRGLPIGPSDAGAPNLLTTWELEDPGVPNRVLVWFQAVAWAEDIAFHVASEVDIVRASYKGVRSYGPGYTHWSGATGFFPQPVQETRQRRLYAIRLPGHRLNAGQRVAIEIELPAGTDVSSALSAGKAVFE